MQIIFYLFWPVSVAIAAWAQSGLVPALREYVPATSALARGAVNALHVRLTLHYYLFALFPIGLLVTGKWWDWPLLAVLARCWFDPLLNWFCGRPVLEVGQTSWTDRTLRRLAPSHYETLAILSRLATAAVGIYLIIK